MKSLVLLMLVALQGCLYKESIESDMLGRCVVLMDKAYVYKSGCSAYSVDYMLSNTTKEVNFSPCLFDNYESRYESGEVFVVDRLYMHHRGKNGSCYRLIVRHSQTNREFDVPACDPPHPKPYWMEYLDGGIYLDDKYIKVTDCPNAEGK